MTDIHGLQGSFSCWTSRIHPSVHYPYGLLPFYRALFPKQISRLPNPALRPVALQKSHRWSQQTASLLVVPVHRPMCLSSFPVALAMLNLSPSLMISTGAAFVYLFVNLPFLFNLTTHFWVIGIKMCGCLAMHTPGLAAFYL